MLTQADGGQTSLDTYFHFYNTQRPHQSLGNRTPREVFNGDSVEETAQMGKGRWFPGIELAPYPGATGPSLNPALILSK